MDDDHFDRVLAFNDDQRYAYFIARAVEDRSVYGLADSDEDWLVWGDAGGDRDVFPVWTHPRLAGALAVGELDGFQPAGTDLDEFMRFLDDLQADDVLVGVMPYPDGSQLLVEPEDLKRDLDDFRSGRYADAFA